MVLNNINNKNSDLNSNFNEKLSIKMNNQPSNNNNNKNNSNLKLITSLFNGISNPINSSENGNISTVTNFAKPSSCVPLIGSSLSKSPTGGGGSGNGSGQSKKFSDEDKKINLNALKNQDPFAKNILDTAFRVAVYKFVSKKNEWVNNISRLCRLQAKKCLIVFFSSPKIEKIRHRRIFISIRENGRTVA